MTRGIEAETSDAADALRRAVLGIFCLFLLGFAPSLREAAAQPSPNAAFTGWAVEVETAPQTGEPGPRVASDPLLAKIRQLLQSPDGLEFLVRQRLQPLADYYNSPTGNLLWQDDALASAFVARLRASERDGLQPRENLIDQLVGVLRTNRFALTREGQIDQQARAELYWSSAFLKYAGLIKKGRLLPTKVDTELYWQPKTIDMAAALQLVGTLGDVDAFFDAWEPQVPLYQSLKSALARHLAIREGGGWPKVDVIDVLKPGESHAIVPQLRRRLAITDGAAATPEPGKEQIYDDDLVEAVKRFQARHGMETDGIVGKKTFFQLNIPIDARIRQIVLSMERVRWMPEDLGNDYILVNIAGYEVRRITGGETREVMRVVVGKPYHQTPVFSKKMTYVEINPYWNVPRSIAVNEELAKLQSNPGALAAKGFEAVLNDNAVPVTTVDWRRYSKSNFPYRLRQRPGPSNALGQVKFMFPNRFNVYMHDTPAKSLFGRSERAFSHGCIRLARPIDMAEQVLAQVEGWDRQRIEQVLASGERTVVTLQKPIDVHITYSTAWRDRDGRVQFRPDIYRRDAKLYAALFGKPYPY